jgi:hypothetical protein
MTGKRIRHIGFQASLLVLIGLVALCQIGYSPLQRFKKGSDGGGSGEVGVNGTANANHLQHVAVLTSLKKKTIGDLAVPGVQTLSQHPISPPTASWNRTCDQNSYVGALKKKFNKTQSALEVAALAATSWLENGIHNDRRDASREIYLRQTHARFFPFNTIHQCKLTCIGGACHDDVS